MPPADRPPPADLDTESLVRCMETNHGLTKQDIADRLGVSESTVCRWKTSQIHPTPDHVEALRALHDSQVCEHSTFLYVCDHPALGADPAEGYDDPPIEDLMNLSELRGLRVQMDHAGGNSSAISRIIVAATAPLPKQVRSRCYRWIRSGPPVFLVLHGVGDDAAITREVIDHIVQVSTTSAPALPVFSESGAVPFAHTRKRSGSGDGKRSQPSTQAGAPIRSRPSGSRKRKG